MDNDNALAMRIINLENVMSENVKATNDNFDKIGSCITSISKGGIYNSIGIICLVVGGTILVKALWDLTDDLYDTRDRMIELENTIKKMTEDNEECNV